MQTARRSRFVPTFQIKIVNEDFTASEERELANADAARREALKGAIAIGAEALYDGKEKLFAAEVSIAEAGQAWVRFVVTIGASPLKAAAGD